MPTSDSQELRLGIDIGGTFTDFVIYDSRSGSLETFKLLSTPANPAAAVLEGLGRVEAALASPEMGDTAPGSPLASWSVIHGSTVATNTLLERKGARTALIATQGFRDVLEIGRQTRPTLYDLSADPVPPLVPTDLRYEVAERVASDGEVLTPLDPACIEPLLAALLAQQVESIAVCLLFSFLRPEHEQHIGGRLRQAGWNVSLSSEILPEYREYERFSTTAVNAYVSPILDRYLGELETALAQPNHRPPGERPTSRFRVMQSNGGHISLAEARRNGARCILSGPAGGIVGARRVAEPALTPNPYAGGKGRSGLHPLVEKDNEDTPLPRGEGSGVRSRLRLITFDMGGTSTDVSLIDGAPQVTVESVVGGCPIRIPVLDIHTIGAGGGSIAFVDAGGALRVGPQSAGADPGPACYGRGDLAQAVPTVTDANLVLGRLAADQFLGGTMPLDQERALAVMTRLGQALGMDPYQAALGAIEVVNAHMERALRLISIERGYDPSGKDGQGAFTLLSFGGAGGLHASSLARRVGISQVLVPPMASTLSAFGMLAADVVKDYTQTVMLQGETPLPAIAAAFAPLIERGRQEVQQEGIAPDELHIEPSLDMRYSGQSYELPVPWPLSPDGLPGETLLGRFHNIHQQAYGYARPEAAVEIVNLRVRATGTVTPPAIPAFPSASPDPAAALIETRPVYLAVTRPGREAAPAPLRESYVPFYRYEALRPGNFIPGPAVVARADTTILVEPGDQAQVDPYHNLIIMIGLNGSLSSQSKEEY